MKVTNQEMLQYPCQTHITDLFQRSGIVQTPSPYDYIKEPMHCCCILACQWREISANYYKNNHARRHVLMHADMIEVQGIRTKCNSTFKMPSYEAFQPKETVFVHLRAIEHNESFCVEIRSITDDVTEAMPLLRIHHSLGELFKPRSDGETTSFPCCGLLECNRDELHFEQTSLEVANEFNIQLHSMFDVPDKVWNAGAEERICMNLKVSQQHIKILSTFVSPVGFCVQNGRCSCEACKHMVSTYHFSQRVLSTDDTIPLNNQGIYLITAGLHLNCDSRDAVFLITCKRCNGCFQYVGQTMVMTVKERVRGLCYEFRNEKKSRLCNHFRQRDHDGVSDWELSIVDQTTSGESLNDLHQSWMDRLETLHKHLGGLNMNPAAGQKTLLLISDNKLANITSALKSSHDIVQKRFSGKAIDEIEKLAPSIVDREKPKRIILHVGSLDVVLSDRHHDDIAADIIQFSQNLTEHHDSVVWISALLPRDGVRNSKVFAVNAALKQRCDAENGQVFIEHSNIDPSAHFKVDRHLNVEGIDNFLENIHRVFETERNKDRKERSIEFTLINQFRFFQ